MRFKSGPRTEEFLNVISHFLGVLAAILGFFFLWERNGIRGNQSAMGIIVYSASLVLLFSASTVYHAVFKKGWKERLRIWDHISIYFLIAGTYTPVCLGTLADGYGFQLLYTVWIMAFLGTFFKIFYTGRYEFLSLLLYLFMGWLVVFDLDTLMANSTESGLNWLFAGGLLYTFGIIFYAWKRIPFNHFIWHLFVLAGAFCHWYYIYFDVI